MNTNALFKIGYGLYILTTSDMGKDNGCIINTVMQVTSNPCRIAICVNKSNYTSDMIRNSKKINLSVLDEGANFELFERFGYRSGRDYDKFLGFVSTKRTANGVLYITENTNAYLSAYVQQEIDLGSHYMFIAQLVDAEILSEKNTATYDYYQKNIKPKQRLNEKKGWRCIICGYVYEGEELPANFICPLCKHGASDFEKIN
ncbi:flavin reductase [bacterium]|nr:flavin reductase [bacterium]